MEFKYYSRDWCDEAQRRLNSDPQHLKAAKALTGTFCFRIYDCPDGTDRIAYWEFDTGKCVNINLESSQAPDNRIRELAFDEAQLRARTSAPFEKLLALNKGEVTILELLTDPTYKIEGDTSEAMKNMMALNSWNKVCMSIPIEE